MTNSKLAPIIKTIETFLIIIASFFVSLIYIMVYFYLLIEKGISNWQLNLVFMLALLILFSIVITKVGKDTVSFAYKIIKDIMKETKKNKS